jgi:DNA-binding GntR family transcriptional regulator
MIAKSASIPAMNVNRSQAVDMNNSQSALTQAVAEASGTRLAPVGRDTVQDRVYTELRRALISGLFEPSQVLTIRSLADALMTSTMPVREALGRLIAEQALEALPNRTVRVPPVTRARLDDLLRARCLIEGDMISLAAARMTPQVLDLAHDIMAQWKELSGDRTPEAIDREVALNKAFHFTIYQAAGSPILMRLIEGLWLQSGPVTRAAVITYAPARTQEASLFHFVILDALRAQDANGARAALLLDISRPFELLHSNLKESGGAA